MTRETCGLGLLGQCRALHEGVSPHCHTVKVTSVPGRNVSSSPALALSAEYQQCILTLTSAAPGLTDGVLLIELGPRGDREKDILLSGFQKDKLQIPLF